MCDPLLVPSDVREALRAACRHGLEGECSELDGLPCFLATGARDATVAEWAEAQRLLKAIRADREYEAHTGRPAEQLGPDAYAEPEVA